MEKDTETETNSRSIFTHPPTLYRTRISLTETPWTETPSGQRPLLDRDPFWTETPWTEIPPGQRLPPPDRDPPGQKNMLRVNRPLLRLK